MPKVSADSLASTTSRSPLSVLAQDAADALKTHGHSIAVAESSTGGLISAALLAVPRASAYYLGGSVIYTLPSRRQVLGIKGSDVAGLSPMTEEMAVPFATRAREQLEATWGIAELGVAGPTSVRYPGTKEDIAAGRSVIAVTGPVTLTISVETGHNDREQNMWTFAQAALTTLARAVRSCD